MTPEEAFRQLAASAREAGTPAAAHARTLLTRHLESRGFRVREQPFAFHPMAANVLPLLGVGLVCLALLLIPLLLLPSPSAFLAPLAWVAGLSALGLLAFGVGSGLGVPGAGRRIDANLIATRGPGPVRRWIVAHVDTKAQGHSMAGRLVAIWVMLAAVLSLSLLAGIRWRTGAPLSAALVAGPAGLALLAGTLAARGRLWGGSPGARDNATGVLAGLMAMEGAEQSTGIILTGAEEFGLVGARALVRAGSLGPAEEIVNLDTITGRGRLYVLYHDRAGHVLARRLAARLAGVAGPVRVQRLPLGILVDSLPLARSGVPAATVARLDWEDLCRLHTPRDTLHDLDPETARAVGRALAEMR